MQKDFDNPSMDEETAQQMDLMLAAALNIIMRHQNPRDFLAWAQEYLPALAKNIFAGIPPEDRPKAAYWLGVSLWNVAPLPENNYKPRPLGQPGRNDPCPCGSGAKHKQCCQRLPAFDPFPNNLFWHLLGDFLSEKELLQSIRENRIPLDIVGQIAFDHYQEENWLKVIKILEPLFDGGGNRLTRADSGLLDLLCDAYGNHYRTDKKKKDLLTRMSRHREPVIQAEAWQRLSSMRQDAGDSAGAMEALHNAMRADPKNPSHSILEIVLLTADNKVELAKQRAGFWLKKLERFEDAYPEIVDTLRLAKIDPISALQQSVDSQNDDDRIARLLDWMAINVERPIPRYKVVPVDDPAGDPLAPDEQEGSVYEDPMKNAVYLEPTKKILSLEAAWSGCTPVNKPFSTQYGYVDEEGLWDNPMDDAWVEFLEEHPEAVDSLDILDDIVTAVYLHPANETPFGPLLLMVPLLERAQQIIQAAAIPNERSLPWIMRENRPALRLLSHRIHLFDVDDQAGQAMLMREYLALNPSDNHGFRTMLANLYLKQGKNDEVIALTEKYPDDMFAETRYGRVLAFYRLNRLSDAKAALDKALDALPLVASYLTRARVAKPKDRKGYGVMLQSPEQAWEYREDMRAEWLATPGCLEWLKKNI